MYKSVRQQTSHVVSEQACLKISTAKLMHSNALPNPHRASHLHLSLRSRTRESGRGEGGEESRQKKTLGHTYKRVKCSLECNGTTEDGECEGWASPQQNVVDLGTELRREERDGQNERV